jgi:hypothetical protein
MSHPSNAPSPKPITAEDVEGWLQTVKRKHLDLHRLAAEPSHSHQRYAVFMDLSALLQEAFEEVRVISASLREGSQMVRGESADLRAYSTQLMEQCARSMECMAQFLPAPSGRHEAERRMLDMFRDDSRHGKPS